MPRIGVQKPRSKKGRRTENRESIYEKSEINDSSLLLEWGHALNPEMDSALLRVMNATIAGAHAHLECPNRRTPDHLGSAGPQRLPVRVAQLQPYVVGRESQLGAYVGEGERELGIAAEERDLPRSRGSIFTPLSSQVKKMGGAGNSGAALSREYNAEPGTFPGRLTKRSERIPCPVFFFMVEVFRPNCSILLRENSRYDCVNQTAGRIFRPHRPGKSRSRHLPPTAL